MRWYIIISVTMAALIGARPLQAAIINAASGSSADIQSACNQANTGDTVKIPAGTFTFTGTVTCNSGINIMGSGQSQTILQFSNPAQWTAMIRINNYSDLPTLISDFTLSGVGYDGSALEKGIYMSSGCKNFRIHRVTFTKFGDSGILVGGNSRGVVDHCTFTNIRYGNVDSFGYGVCVTGDGIASWSRPLSLGTEEAVFIEDCSFTGVRHAVASNEGSRYVFRYNQVMNTPYNWLPIDAHGREYGSSTGSRSWEIYGNTVWNNTGTSAWCGTGLRGGDGVVFNNTYGPGINHPVYLCNRLDDSHTSCTYPCPDQTRELHAWNNTNNGAPVSITVRTGHESFFVEGRDYFSYARPGYTPYPYPHPLTGGSVVISLSITTASLENGEVGAVYSATLAATGGTTPYTWTVASGSLPDGLTLSTNGTISGTPTTAGTTDFTVRVTDNDEATENQTLSLFIVDEGEKNLANGTTHIANSENFAAENPVTALWDSDISGSSAGSPGNMGQDSFWVEFDLGGIYELSLIRLMGDADGTWISTAYTVQVKSELSDNYTTIIDNEACLGNQWHATEVSIEARYIRLSVIGDTDVHAVQAREFEVYGKPLVSVNNALAAASSFPVTITRRSSTIIELFLHEETPVRVSLHDMTGRIIGTPFDGSLPSGRHKINPVFYATGRMTTGARLYVCRLFLDNTRIAIPAILSNGIR